MRKYSSTTRANSRRILPKKQLAIVTLCVAIILTAGIFFGQVFSAISYVVLYPVVSISHWLATSEETLPQYLRARHELLAEMEGLRRQLSSESGTQLSISRLLDENQQLRSLLGGEEQQRIVARVIARPTKLRYDLLQIDRGTDHGIVVGAPVFVGFDSVIGVVVHTTPRYAFVDLVTSSGFLSTAYVVGPNVLAELEGLGGGIARVKLPQGVTLTVGNLVVLPSVASGVYGEVVAVENEPTQPEQFGYVTPPVSLNSLRYVSVADAVPEVKTSPEIDAAIAAVAASYFRLDPASWSPPEIVDEESTALGESESVETDL